MNIVNLQPIHSNTSTLHKSEKKKLVEEVGDKDATVFYVLNLFPLLLLVDMY